MVNQSKDIRTPGLQPPPRLHPPEWEDWLIERLVKNVPWGFVTRYRSATVSGSHGIPRCFGVFNGVFSRQCQCLLEPPPDFRRAVEKVRERVKAASPPAPEKGAGFRLRETRISSPAVRRQAFAACRGRDRCESMGYGLFSGCSRIYMFPAPACRGYFLQKNVRGIRPVL